METMKQSQQKIIDEFAFFDNWIDKYQYIVELGRQLPPFPSKWETEEHKVQGCQSNVWLHTVFNGEKLHFEANSDSAIVRGLIAILLRIYNDRTPQEILSTPPEFIDAIGLKNHLSINRSNGLYSMIKEIQRYAKHNLMEDK